MSDPTSSGAAPAAPATPGGTPDPNAPTFASLEQIYQMFTPADLVGTVQPNLGGPLEKTNSVYARLLALLENDGRGVLSIADFIAQIKALSTPPSGAVAGGTTPPAGTPDFSKIVSIWTKDGLATLDARAPSTSSSEASVTDPITKASSVIGSLNEIIGANFTPDDLTPTMAVIESHSPFFNPTMRNTKRAEIFLNSMPSTVLEQLVPYMQVEFQFTHDVSPVLGSLSQLKLLQGAITPAASSADAAMAEAHMMGMTTAASTPGMLTPAAAAAPAAAGSASTTTPSQLDYVGMEVFTSPVTLTNPQPNVSNGTAGPRYTDVLDPYRPFATLQHVSINSAPAGAGFYCYKKANLAIKVHDRSRLNEIADLLRPRTYTGITIWLTYGWRAPTRPDAGAASSMNPYFTYVNNNLMMREAYHVMNSSFTFDHIGQVTINLELFTQGITELRELMITDTNDSPAMTMKYVQGLIESIKDARQKLKLDPPEGPSKEIRVYQVLDAAVQGQYPNFSGSPSANDAIKSLITTLRKQGSAIDQVAVTQLNTALTSLYKTPTATSNKFVTQQNIEQCTSQAANDFMTEIQSGKDPFLPDAATQKGCPKLAQAIAGKKVVSFGKLFSTIALRNITALPSVVDEVQVFFYNLNEHCGPVSCSNVAEFPIDIKDFQDALKDHFKSLGSVSMKLEDFLSLVINSQFLDKRAWGYGFRDLYSLANPKEPTVPANKQGEFEKRFNSAMNSYGPFCLPAIEMYIEMSHRRVSDVGDVDIMQQMNYAAPNGANMNAAAAALLRNSTGTGFVSANPAIASDPYAKQYAPSQTVVSNVNTIGKVVKGVKINADPDSGRVTLSDVSNFQCNQQIKDVVSKLVPTIRFGCNGTTITSANLTSKADKLLSTVQMQRNQTVKNEATPNGSGPLGLPSRVIPAQLTLTTLGNPLATMAQQYFIDFQTGTTLDNLYIVTGLTHSFSPGKFETSWTFSYVDGYAVFEGAPNVLSQFTAVPPSTNGVPIE